jgi:hypothetical protein
MKNIKKTISLTFFLGISIAMAEESPIILTPDTGYIEDMSHETPDYPPALEPYPGDLQTPAPLDTAQMPQQGQSQSTATNYLDFSNVGTATDSSLSVAGAMSREEIERSAATCQSEIDSLWAQRRAVARHRQPYFQQKMAQAQTKCRELQNQVKFLKQIDQNIMMFRQSTSDAQQSFS